LVYNENLFGFVLLNKLFTGVIRDTDRIKLIIKIDNSSLKKYRNAI